MTAPAPVRNNNQYFKLLKYITLQVYFYNQRTAASLIDFFNVFKNTDQYIIAIVVVFCFIQKNHNTSEILQAFKTFPNVVL